MAKDKTASITKNKDFIALEKNTKAECEKIIKLRDHYKALESEKQIQQKVLDQTQDPNTRQDATKKINRIDKQLKALKDEIANEKTKLDCLDTELSAEDQQLSSMQNVIDDRKLTLTNLHTEISTTISEIDTLFQQPSASAQFTLTLPDGAGASAPQYPIAPPSYFDSVNQNNNGFQSGGSNNSALDQQEPATASGFTSQLFGTFKSYFHTDHANQ